MADLKLDVTDDLVFEKGDLVLVRSKDAIVQDLKIRLRFFKGEWKLDLRLGVPYYENILGQKFNLSVVKSIYQTVILETPGINSLNDLVLAFDPSSRVLTITFIADTITGEIVFREDLII